MVYVGRQRLHASCMDSYEINFHFHCQSQQPSLFHIGVGHVGQLLLYQ